MRHRHPLGLGLCLLLLPALLGCEEAFDPPETRRTDVHDDYHGVKVADPYRWLEDLDAEETRAWIEAQNRVTEDWLSKEPRRAEIADRLRALWDHERFGVPTVRGGRCFYLRNDGLEEQSVLHVIDRPDAEPRVLLDPNGLSADGTVALADHYPSPDGKLLAYALSSAGSDWRTLRVRDVETGTDLEDELRWVKFSGVAWLRDGSGFYYSRYDEPAPGEAYEGANYDQRLMFHRLGTEQSTDRLVYARPDHREWGFGAGVTEDGRWLTIHVWRGTHRENAFFHRELGREDAPVVELLPDFDASWDFVGNDGTRFYFFTDLDAPRGRVVVIDVAREGPPAPEEIVPETQDVLRSVSLVGDRLVCSYLHHARSRVRVHDLAGRHVRDVELPGIGTAEGFHGERSQRETYYGFSSFTTPMAVLRYDVESGESTLFRRPEVDFDPADYVTEQVFATSRDGTRVPIFLTRRKGLERDAANPTLLYGYGGFNIPLTPWFSVKNLVWMEMGGVYAVANLRGGGEYGREWHQAGTKLRKQNVFDDFIAAAEWLVESGWTSNERLAIAGGSNGGLLVGACMTQRPELFGACLPAVGVLDMLRFHKFTIGWAWVSDYGCADDPEEFRALHAYSPVHNVRPGTRYPPTLITTGDHDDRVVPSHSFKFAAALQHAQAGPAPILIRIETRAGHGAGKPTSKLIDEAADQWAFLHRALRAGE